MGQHIWRDRVERIADEFIDLAAAPDVRGVEAIRETLDLTDQMLAAIGRLNATLAMHLRLDAAQGLIVSEVAASPEHDAVAAARVDAAAARARAPRADHPGSRSSPPGCGVRLRPDRPVQGRPDDEPEDPHYRVTMSNPNQVSTLEESRWSSLAAAMVQARRLAAETPIGQTVEVYAFEDGELLPEPIVVHAAQATTTSPDPLDTPTRRIHRASARSCWPRARPVRALCRRSAGRGRPGDRTHRFR